LSKEEFSKAFTEDDNFKMKEILPREQLCGSRNMVEERMRQIAAGHSHPYDNGNSKFNPVILNNTTKPQDGFKPVIRDNLIINDHTHTQKYQLSNSN